MTTELSKPLSFLPNQTFGNCVSERLFKNCLPRRARAESPQSVHSRHQLAWLFTTVPKQTFAAQGPLARYPAVTCLCAQLANTIPSTLLFSPLPHNRSRISSSGGLSTYLFPGKFAISNHCFFILLCGRIQISGGRGWSLPFQSPQLLTLCWATKQILAGQVP